MTKDTLGRGYQALRAGCVAFSVLLPSQLLTLRLVIISFRPAWLARALLSFKRAQSSGND